ncbi:MAG TPA: ribosome small subunit-dependent GTPase A [Mycobacteriales bacterium]|jgi:ribosome biogenesis GTPase|nr:ribosome small subunit-dependent GTPase A [Mycobacteriales bacterium]
MARRDLDEDDIRVKRAGPSRRRTRDQPKHESAEPGFVVAVDRGRFTCQVDGRQVVAMRAGPMRRTSVVVGDAVDVVGDTSGAVDALARIVRVGPRTSVLRRTADDTDPTERIVVANADQLVIVMAVADPPPVPRLIDRCLVAAYDGDLDPVLCLTKHDLGDAADVVTAYRPLGLRTVRVSRAEGDDGFAELRGVLTGRTSVLFGQSGVGKSTLVNRLVPGATRATGAVTALGKGSHTSSSVIALPLPDGGWVIDTPGVRSFGLGHVTPETLLQAFPELQPGTVDCLPGCDHLTDDFCGLDKLVAAGLAPPERLASYRRLLTSREGEGEEAPGQSSETVPPLRQ